MPSSRISPPLPRLPSSFFSASLDPSFLTVRARCLEAYLAAAVSYFGTSLQAKTGPTALLDFLSPMDGGGGNKIGGVASAVLFADGAAGVAPTLQLEGGARDEPPRTPLPAAPPGALGEEGEVEEGKIMRGDTCGEGGMPEGDTERVPEGGTRLPHGALMSRLLAAAAAQPCPAEKDVRALKERREVRGLWGGRWGAGRVRAL
jgi:hypothetical protein